MARSANLSSEIANPGVNRTSRKDEQTDLRADILGKGRRRSITIQTQAPPELRTVPSDAEANDLLRAGWVLLGTSQVGWHMGHHLEPEPDGREGIVAFLSNIDPGELSRASLERLGGFGGASSPTEAMLEILKEWARGDTT